MKSADIESKWAENCIEIAVTNYSISLRDEKTFTTKPNMSLSCKSVVLNCSLYCKISWLTNSFLVFFELKMYFFSTRNQTNGNRACNDAVYNHTPGKMKVAAQFCQELFLRRLSPVPKDQKIAKKVSKSWRTAFLN